MTESDVRRIVREEIQAHAKGEGARLSGLLKDGAGRSGLLPIDGPITIKASDPAVFSADDDAADPA